MRKLTCIFTVVTYILAFCSCGNSNSGKDEADPQATSLIAEITTTEEVTTVTTLASTVIASTTTVSTTTIKTEPSAEAETTENNDIAIDDIVVDKGLFDVSITIPAEFISDPDKMISEANATEGIESCTLNEDGSVTYIMTKEAHEKMIEEFKSGFDESFNSQLNSGIYTSITKVEHNEDFTDFTIYVSDYELYKGSMDGMIQISILLYVGYYDALRGETTDESQLKFTVVDDSTGEKYEL